MIMAASILAFSAAFTAPIAPTSTGLSKIVMQQQRWPRDPEATRDQAAAVSVPAFTGAPVHQRETFAEYLAKRGFEKIDSNANYLADRIAPAPAAYHPPTTVPVAAPVAAPVDYATKPVTQFMPADTQREAAEDAALPPLEPYTAVRVINRPGHEGRTGTIYGIDSYSGKYHVWVPHAPVGNEDSRNKPILMLQRRSHLQPI